MVVKVAEVVQEPPRIAKHFEKLKDPRKGTLRYHKFLDILTIAICAVICGADDYEAIAEFGQAKAEWLATFLELPNGIPAHDTFWRVFEALNPEQFQHCFMNWMAGVRKTISREVVSLDGKRLRRSYANEDDKAAIHMVSAWATTNRLVLGQQKVDEKSNEITAIPELLRALDLHGCIVTIDAMGCQTAIAELIVKGQADYLLSLKGNQSNLHEDVVLLFDDLVASNFTAYTYDHAATVDKNHGRIETRRCWTIDYPSLDGSLWGADNWPKLTTLVKVQSERRIDDKRTLEAATSLLAIGTALCTSWSIPERTGILRTLSIGSWTSPFARTSVAFVRAMPLRTLLFCATSPSICSNTTLVASWASRIAVYALLGMTTISFPFSNPYSPNSRLP